MPPIFGREPALILGVIATALSLAATFGLEGMSQEQAALIVALVSAVFAAVSAAVTRPVAPAAFTGVVSGGAALLAGYGLDLSPEAIGSLNALVIAVLALLTRGQVTPVTPAAKRPTSI